MESKVYNAVELEKGNAYEGKERIKIRSRLFMNNDKTASPDDKKPNFKNAKADGQGAGWYFLLKSNTSGAPDGVDINIEVPVDRMIELLESYGYTITQSAASF